MSLLVFFFNYSYRFRRMTTTSSDQIRRPAFREFDLSPTSEDYWDCTFLIYLKLISLFFFFLQHNMSAHTHIHATKLFMFITLCGSCRYWSSFTLRRCRYWQVWLSIFVRTFQLWNDCDSSSSSHDFISSFWPHKPQIRYKCLHIFSLTSSTPAPARSALRQQLEHFSE